MWCRLFNPVRSQAAALSASWRRMSDLLLMMERSELKKFSSKKMKEWINFSRSACGRGVWSWRWYATGESWPAKARRVILFTYGSGVKSIHSVVYRTQSAIILANRSSASHVGAGFRRVCTGCRSAFITCSVLLIGCLCAEAVFSTFVGTASLKWNTYTEAPD